MRALSLFGFFELLGCVDAYLSSLGSLGLLFLETPCFCFLSFLDSHYFYVVTLDAVPLVSVNVHYPSFFCLFVCFLDWMVSISPILPAHGLLSPSSEFFISVILLTSKIYILFTSIISSCLLVFFGGKVFTYCPLTFFDMISFRSLNIFIKPL